MRRVERATENPDPPRRIRCPCGDDSCRKGGAAPLNPRLPIRARPSRCAPSCRPRRCRRSSTSMPSRSNSRQNRSRDSAFSKSVRAAAISTRRPRTRRSSPSATTSSPQPAGRSGGRASPPRPDAPPRPRGRRRARDRARGGARRGRTLAGAHLIGQPGGCQRVADSASGRGLRQASLVTTRHGPLAQLRIVEGAFGHGPHSPTGSTAARRPRRR